MGEHVLNDPVLVLNQSYEPLNVCGVRRALVLLCRERAQTLETGEGELHAATAVFDVPSVIRLLHMVKRPVLTRRLSRREVFYRDRFTCQYCGRQTRDLTLDHVVPRVHGGVHSWDNVVAACVPCNHRKAGRTPRQAGMRLKREPAPPRLNPFAHLMHRQLPDQWSVYLPWKQPAAPVLIPA